MQKLELELSVSIPSDCIIIKKAEYIELKSNDLVGTYWSMKDLEKRTGKSYPWIKDNILYCPRLKKILDSEHGGCVVYPREKGENWIFIASKMAIFLETYCELIFREDKRNTL